jgi:hypothetical protein
MIVGNLYDDIENRQASVNHTRNMLEAFQWRLSDSYFLNLCDREKKFFFDEPIQSNIRQLTGNLETDELLLEEGWYANIGLKKVWLDLKSCLKISEYSSRDAWTIKERVKVNYLEFYRK